MLLNFPRGNRTRFPDYEMEKLSRYHYFITLTNLSLHLVLISIILPAEHTLTKANQLTGIAANRIFPDLWSQTLALCKYSFEQKRQKPVAQIEGLLSNFRPFHVHSRAW